MPRLARGSRDDSGRWVADDPSDYPPMDIHGILPWSILDQSSQKWQDRKKWWLARIPAAIPQATPGMIATGRHGHTSGGVSVFDPVLAELCLTWYAPTGRAVHDPFAGSPVRGIVADTLGYTYTGVDINPAQVAANQAATGLDLWALGDGTTHATRAAGYILTCPPYHNRERYTDHPGDLSSMTWEGFGQAVRRAMRTCWESLAEDRFMTWVISDVRDHRGHLRRLPALVGAAAEAAGFRLCNEQILIAPAGTRAKTMRVPWEACRTTSRRHQIVLTWVKGDRRAAAKEVRHG